MKYIHITCIVALLFSGACLLRSQSEPTNFSADIKSKIDDLKAQLHWSDENGRQQFSATKLQVTKQIWTLIDSFINQAYDSSDVSLEQLKSTLDSVLGHKSGDLQNTVIFPVSIPIGKFLIVGLEVTRGGRAIPENAISFRAYGQVDRRWRLIDHVELQPDDDFLVDLKALALAGGFPGKFGFIAWAMEPPLTPYKEIVRVYSFDGQKFTTEWAPHAFVMATVPSFVTLTSTGFDLHTLTPDRATQILQSYIVVAGEVIKSTQVDSGP
ncbi:MAG: hypothetical protein JO061_07560 [Acidobacteriaceae bacterium]|nr:hypothetical protein [Acidobacteriaceae bacterium]